MKEELITDAPAPIKRGRKSLNYEMFDTDIVYKVSDKSVDKIRQRLRNIVTGARVRGYHVRSWVVSGTSGHAGYVSKR